MLFLVESLPLTECLWLASRGLCAKNSFATNNVNECRIADNLSFLFLQTLGCYDVVAYFTQSAPVKGNSEFVYVWKGGKWYFANRENQEAFKASPEKYAPQYGGYCAYGTAGGYKAPTDPDAWTVSDGKLYLNYNKKVMENWRKDQANFIDKANKNWPTVKLQE